MSKQKIKKNGQAIIGGILMIILLVAFVFFIFFFIRRPTTPPAPSVPPLMVAGVAPEAIEEMKKEITEIEKNYPAAKDLPYGGPFYGEPFFIDPPTPEGIIWISIDETTNQEKTKEAALDWMKQKGYNPEDYDIRFESINFPK